MTDEELASQIRTYSELKKQNKDIDVAALALSALQGHVENMLTPKEKRIAYLVSLSLPPLGLLYALKFWTSNKEDGKTAAYMCIGLTAASIVIGIVFLNVLISGSGLSVGQFQDAAQQSQQLLQ